MDDRHIEASDARPAHEILATDPLYRMLGSALANPVVLGIVCGILAIVMIVAGPSSDSHFIYTDF